MMIINICLLLILIKSSYCKTSITTYPLINLLENSPINTLVVKLNSSIDISNSTKLVLLNLNGYESNKFSIINGSVYTISLIDREEFVREKYCLDNSYCKIELHILINDGYGYWIIPIHIIDENDNKPEFRDKEIEFKFRENILNGYKIPFEGAKDFDEGKNGEIDYILDCSKNVNENFPMKNLNETSRNCFPLFELIILTQSSPSLNYDQLALKFHPSSSINIKNEYKLKVYAIDKNQNSNSNSINLNIKIEQKEKSLKFSLSEYEFVILLNSSFLLNENLNFIGRVYAISNNPFDRIYYKILNNNLTNFIQINSLTGELNFLNQNSLRNNQIQFDVQASTLTNSSHLLITTITKVQIFVRYFNLLNNISFEFQINSSKKNQISQLNNSKTFFIDQNIQINQNLFQIFIHSISYPTDKYILSLQNHLNIFSLSSSLTNNYLLKTREHLSSTSIYLLNIGVKHKLSQQWLPNLTIELIIVDQWTTTIVRRKIINNKSEMTTMNMMIKTELINQSTEFCVKNQIYILYEINKKKKNEIGLLKVIKSNLILLKTNQNLFISMNKSEILINGCRMLIEKLNKTFLNKSFEYELCLSSSSITNQCYHIKIKDERNLITIKDQNKIQNLFSSMKSIELIMLIISIIFISITLILILLICQLKEINMCLKLKQNYHLNNVQHRLSSSKIRKRVHSIVIRDSRSPSFQSMRIKNAPYIFNIDDFIQEETHPSSSNMFILPSIGKSSLSLSSSLTCSFDKKENPLPTLPQTSSSSSFLQETKQLLEMISNNQQFDSSKLVSEV